MCANEVTSPIWRQFTKDQQDILRQYLHVPNACCPPHALSIKRYYWRLQKKRSRAFVAMKRHKNVMFGEFAKARQSTGTRKDLEDFKYEGRPK